MLALFRGLFAPQLDLHNFIREIGKNAAIEVPTHAQIVLDCLLGAQKEISAVLV